MSSIVDWFIIELFFKIMTGLATILFLKKRKAKALECCLDRYGCIVGNPKFNMFDYVQRDWSPALGGELINYCQSKLSSRQLFTKRVNFS